jgi:Ca2+-binding RTX toxin-like protein
MLHIFSSAIMPDINNEVFANKKYLIVQADIAIYYDEIMHWRQLNPEGVLFLDEGGALFHDAGYIRVFNFDGRFWDSSEMSNDIMPLFMDAFSEGSLILDSDFAKNIVRGDDHLGESGAIKRYTAENFFNTGHDHENLAMLDDSYKGTLGEIRDYRDKVFFDSHKNFEHAAIHPLHTMDHIRGQNKLMPYMIEYYNKKNDGLNLILTEREFIASEILEVVRSGVKSAKFVMGVGHWTAVDLFIDHSGNVSVIEIESIQQGSGFLKQNIKQYLPDAHVVSVAIDIQRQNYGCNIFSVELAKKMFQEKVALEALHKLNIEDNFPAANMGRLPDSFIPPDFMKHASSPNRLIQYTDLNEDFKSRIVNTKGETLLQRQSSLIIEQQINGRNLKFSNSIDKKAISIIGKVLAEFESPTSRAQSARAESEWHKMIYPEPHNGADNTPPPIGPMAPTDNKIVPKGIPTLQELATTALGKMPPAPDTPLGMPGGELGAVFSDTLASLKVFVSGPAERNGWKLKSILEIVDDRKSTGTVAVLVVDTDGRRRSINFSADDFNDNVTEKFSHLLLEKTSASLAKARLRLATNTSQAISESLGIYSTVKGVTDFLHFFDSAEGNAEDLAFSGAMAGWGVTELAGLNKLLTDAMGNAYRSIILRETESFARAGYPNGLDAAIGQTLNKLGKIAGLSEEAAGLLSRVGGKVPLAAIALGGYALYSDIELIKHLKSTGASQGDIDKAIASTVLDALSTAAFAAAPYTGPAAPFVAAFGMVLSFVRGTLYESSASTIPDILLSFLVAGIIPPFLDNLRRIYGDGSYEAIQNFRAQMDAMYDGNNPSFSKFVQIEQQGNQRYLSFLAHDSQNALTKEASYYGNQYATLGDDGSLALLYWTPAHSHSNKYNFYGLKQGSVSSRLSAGDDSLIIMGVSTTATPYYRQLNGPVRRASTDAVYGGDHLNSMGFQQSNVFGIQGNSHDNTFTSIYSSTTQAYRYNIKGGGGDDALIFSNAGQYYFDGEANGISGDWLTSTGAQQPTNARLLLSLAPTAIGAVGALATDQTDLTRAQALPNLYVNLTAVENIHGSEKNEVFVGNDQANIIVTGGGSDKVYLSEGGDNYYITGDAAAYVQFHTNGGASKTELQDTVYLSNVSYDKLAWMNGALSRYYIDPKNYNHTRVYNNGHEVFSSDDYRAFVRFENLDVLRRFEFVTSDGVRLHYIKQEDGSVKTIIVGCDTTQPGPIGSRFKDTYLLNVTQITDKVFTTPTQGLAILDLGPARSWQQLMAGYIRSTITNTGEICAVGASGTFERIVMWDTKTTDFSRMLFKGGTKDDQWTLQMAGVQNGWLLARESSGLAGAVTSLLVEDSWGRYSLNNGQLVAIELKHASQVNLIFRHINDPLNLQRLASLMTAVDITVVGSDGNDIINGTASYSSLTLYGGKGDDILYGSGTADILYGEEGNDTFYVGKGPDAIDGGDGTDTVVYEQALQGVIAQLLNTDLSKLLEVGGDYLLNIENLNGSRYDDFLIGNNQNNIIRGGMGDDLLIGGAGDDTLSGGDGNDTFYGGEGADRIDGGEGIDTVVYEGSDQGGVTVQLQEPDGSLFLPLQNVGEAQGDQLISIENLTGSRYDDLLIGNSQQNILNGGAGDDILAGGGGLDTLIGGAGDDVYVLAVGSKARLSAAGNGEGIDILNFGGSTLRELSGFRGNDDLYIRDQQGTEAMLNDWFKGQTRYELETFDDALDNDGLLKIVHQWVSYPSANDSVVLPFNTQMMAVI